VSRRCGCSPTVRHRPACLQMFYGPPIDHVGAEPLSKRLGSSTVYQTVRTRE